MNRVGAGRSKRHLCGQGALCNEAEVIDRAGDETPQGPTSGETYGWGQRYDRPRSGTLSAEREARSEPTRLICSAGARRSALADPGQRAAAGPLGRLFADHVMLAVLVMLAG